jgi:hypothetical protein
MFESSGGESLTGNMRWEPRLKWITNDKFIINLLEITVYQILTAFILFVSMH